MSKLTGKKLLVIGGDNNKIFEIVDKLSGFGVESIFIKGDEVTAERIKQEKADFVILNYLQKNELSADVFDLLNGQDLSKVIPVFALIEEGVDNIGNVLVRGAADYITEKEKIDSVLQKIQTIVAGDVFKDSSTIDISPAKVILTATGLKIFIVEDDPLLRNLLSVRMEKSSFPTEFSRDGKDVIPAMKQFKPDAIILDLMLPGISGFEILEKIKKEQDLSDIPVIVFSNKDGEEERKRSQELGANAFYVKAMTDLAELVENIEGLVSKK